MRTPTRFLTSLLCFVAALAGFPAAADEAPSRRVWLQLQDNGELMARQRRALQDHVSEIWRPYGVHLEWHDRLPDANEWNDQVLLVLLSDEAMARQSNKAARPTTLGAGMFIPTADRFLQTIFVSPRATRRVMRNARLLEGLMLGAVFGQALGRVVADEIGHILLDMPGHVGDGLMKPHFDAVDLIEPSSSHLQLGPNELQLLAAQPPAPSATAAER